jgi:hypothetical protein
VQLPRCVRQKPKIFLGNMFTLQTLSLDEPSLDNEKDLSPTDLRRDCFLQKNRNVKPRAPGTLSPGSNEALILSPVPKAALQLL